MRGIHNTKCVLGIAVVVLNFLLAHATLSREEAQPFAYLSQQRLEIGTHHTLPTIPAPGTPPGTHKPVGFSSLDVEGDGEWHTYYTLLNSVQELDPEYQEPVVFPYGPAAPARKVLPTQRLPGMATGFHPTSVMTLEGSLFVAGCQLDVLDDIASTILLQFDATTFEWKDSAVVEFEPWSQRRSCRGAHVNLDTQREIIFVTRIDDTGCGVARLLLNPLRVVQSALREYSNTTGHIHLNCASAVDVATGNLLVEALHGHGRIDRFNVLDLEDSAYTVLEIDRAWVEWRSDKMSPLAAGAWDGSLYLSFGVFFFLEVNITTLTVVREDADGSFVGLGAALPVALSDGSFAERRLRMLKHGNDFYWATWKSGSGGSSIVLARYRDPFTKTQQAITNDLTLDGSGPSFISLTTETDEDIHFVVGAIRDVRGCGFQCRSTLFTVHFHDGTLEEWNVLADLTTPDDRKHWLGSQAAIGSGIPIWSDSSVARLLIGDGSILERTSFAVQPMVASVVDASDHHAYVVTNANQLLKIGLFPLQVKAFLVIETELSLSYLAVDSVRRTVVAASTEDTHSIHLFRIPIDAFVASSVTELDLSTLGNGGCTALAVNRDDSSLFVATHATPPKLAKVSLATFTLDSFIIVTQFQSISEIMVIEPGRVGDAGFTILGGAALVSEANQPQIAKMHAQDLTLEDPVLLQTDIPITTPVLSSFHDMATEWTYWTAGSSGEVTRSAQIVVFRVDPNDLSSSVSTSYEESSSTDVRAPVFDGDRGRVLLLGLEEALELFISGCVKGMVVEGNECQPCMGGYSATVGQITCSLCPRGTASNVTAPQTIFACRPCESGTYSPEPGSTYCEICGKDYFCPVGASSQIEASTLQSAVETSALPPLSLKDATDSQGFTFLIGTIIASVLLGFCCVFKVANDLFRRTKRSIFGCEIWNPIKFILRKCDFLFMKIHAVNDGFPLVVKRTALGGIFTLIFCIFALCFIIAFSVQWRDANEEEIRNLEPVSALSSIITDFEIELKLWEYSQACECGTDVVLDTINGFRNEGASPPLLCQFLEEGHACLVTWKCPRCRIVTNDPSVRLAMPGNGHAVAITGRLEIQAPHPDHRSFASGTFLPDGGGILQKEAIIGVTLTPASYENNINETKRMGFLVDPYKATVPGVAPEDMYTDQLSIRLAISVSSTSLAITVQRKDSATAFIALIAGAITGLYGLLKVLKVAWGMLVMKLLNPRKGKQLVPAPLAFGDEAVERVKGAARRGPPGRVASEQSGQLRQESGQAIFSPGVVPTHPRYRRRKALGSHKLEGVTGELAAAIALIQEHLNIRAGDENPSHEATPAALPSQAPLQFHPHDNL